MIDLTCAQNESRSGLQEGECGDSSEGGSGKGRARVEGGGGVGGGRCGDGSGVALSSGFERGRNFGVQEGSATSLVDGGSEALVRVGGEEDRVNAVCAVGAEGGFVSCNSLQTHLLSRLIRQDGLDRCKCNGRLRDVLKSVQFVCQARLACGVLQTTSIAKLIVRVDKVVDQSRNVGTVVTSKIRTTRLKECAVGRAELSGGAGGFSGAADRVGEVRLQSRNHRCVSGRAECTNRARQRKTRRHTGICNKSNQTRRTTGRETGNERRIKLRRSGASKRKHSGADERSDDTHLGGSRETKEVLG